MNNSETVTFIHDRCILYYERYDMDDEEYEELIDTYNQLIDLMNGE